jgi:hypothetical protein
MGLADTIQRQNRQTQMTAAATPPPITGKTSPLLYLLAADLLIISLIELFSATVSTLVIIVMDTIAEKAGSVTGSFFRLFPAFGVIPLLTAIAAFVFLYLAFKAGRAAPSASKKVIMALLLIPVPLAYISQAISYRLVNQLSLPNNVIAKPYQTTILAVKPTNPLFLLSALALLLTLLGIKKFRAESEELGRFSGWAVKGFLFLVVVPILAIVGYKYYQTTDTDQGFSSAKSQVTYQLYRPVNHPLGLTQATRFLTDQELAGKKNAVLVDFDIPLLQAVKNNETKIVFLRQVGVDTSFNLKAFVDNYHQNKEPTWQTETVNLPMATGRTAYFAGWHNDQGSFDFLFFTTPDRVLIEITGVNRPKEDLVVFAQSLRKDDPFSF